MAEHTEISWCHHTMNFWVGCTKVSPACDFCYAETWANRWPRYAGAWSGERYRTTDANWRKALRWNREAKEAGERRRVFSNSLSDFFDNQVPTEWRRGAWEIIGACDALDWMLLTKRPQNIPKMSPIAPDHCRPWRDKWPWPNVWLGTTTEDQERYDQRMPHLAAVDCAKRFVSYEPALGPVDFLSGYSPGDEEPWAAKLDLVICGGESGAHARPMHPAWARSARDQCETAGIYFHFKQWGESVSAKGLPGHLPISHVFDDGYQMVRVGKHVAGRLLDGREHNGMPA